MPPFGSEPKEKETKRLSFLSLAPAPKPRVQANVKVFGHEPAEPGDSVEFPFGTEPEEGGGIPQNQQAFVGPFGAEPEEESVIGRPRKTKSTISSSSASVRKPTPTLFGAEPEEGNDSDEPGSDASSSDEPGKTKYELKADTVFCFGWKAVLDVEKASLWQKNMDHERSAPQKRRYDNSKRSATALYVRKQNTGVFKQNGVDPERLQKLFAAATCCCA